MRSGLSGPEAAERLRRYGPNALPEAKPPGVWRRLGAQFRSPIIYVLLAALVFEAVVWFTADHGDVPVEAIAIAVILLANAGLGVWQEQKAEGALARLRQLAAPQVWALRDGRLVRLAARDLVPGDVVRLEAGDRVPADGVVHDTRHLAIDESIVTGESVPVDKADGQKALSGTLVTTGIAWLEVAATGAESTMGRLATMLGDVKSEPTPLERRLTVFGNRVARWVLALAGAIALGGVLLEGIENAGHVFLFAVALAVAAVPEGLPAVLTVTLALGVERMARRKAVVRKLAAVEALGSVTVIATDKTGTLTENRLEVRAVDTPHEGQVLRAMVLANDADPGSEAGDPLDQALLGYATEHGIDAGGLRRAFGRHSGRPFDAQWKFARVTGEEQGRLVSYLKGAPEEVLARCRLDGEQRALWTERIERHAKEGFRLLAFAGGPDEREDDLDWLGLALLWDPPRAEVPAAIRAAQEAGIRILMVTGDHPATAAAVAAAVGIKPGATLTGADIEGSTDEELRRAVATASVFARVAPEHKLRIVEALSAAGEVVAMTGDGVNDAPALKRSAVGVAMGQRGSDVSREVADLVLLDDNFATVVAAIEEGRSIYENIQKFVRFLFATNFAELLVVSVGATAAFWLDLRETSGALLLPLTAAQLLWINLVTDGAPALALGLDHNPGVMRAPPRDPTSPLLDHASLRFVLVAGGVMALVALALLGLLPRLIDEPLEATRTATFLFLAIAQLVFTFPARRVMASPAPNRVLHWTVGVSVVAQLGMLFIPGLARVFGLVVPSPAALASVVAALVLAWAAGHLAAARISRSVPSGAAGQPL